MQSRREVHHHLGHGVVETVAWRLRRQCFGDVDESLAPIVLRRGERNLRQDRGRTSPEHALDLRVVDQRGHPLVEFGAPAWATPREVSAQGEQQAVGAPRSIARRRCVRGRGVGGRSVGALRIHVGRFDQSIGRVVPVELVEPGLAEALEPHGPLG